MERMQLYTYYRSQASFRVRIAMNLKGVAHDDTYLHLEKGDQFDPGYRAVNPQMVVPTLVDGDLKLFQSLAIQSCPRLWRPPKPARKKPRPRRCCRRTRPRAPGAAGSR